MLLKKAIFKEWIYNLQHRRKYSNNSGLTSRICKEHKNVIKVGSGSNTLKIVQMTLRENYPEKI